MKLNKFNMFYLATTCLRGLRNASTQYRHSADVYWLMSEIEWAKKAAECFRRVGVEIQTKLKSA